jgi:hypothetical protein
MCFPVNVEDKYVAGGLDCGTNVADDLLQVANS